MRRDCSNSPSDAFVTLRITCDLVIVFWQSRCWGLKKFVFGGALRETQSIFGTQGDPDMEKLNFTLPFAGYDQRSFSNFFASLYAWSSGYAVYRESHTALYRAERNLSYTGLPWQQRQQRLCKRRHAWGISYHEDQRKGSHIDESRYAKKIREAARISERIVDAYREAANS